MTKITRMQLLRGDLQGKNNAFRPPWSLPEDYFIDYCTRCDQCIDACFDELIVKGRGGFPEMDFKQGGCDFCGDCLDVCKTDALHKIAINITTNTAQAHLNSDDYHEAYEENSEADAFLPPWHIKASIDLTKCLSMNAVICRSCGESCDDEAIKFDLKLGGIAEPVLNDANCTGCGACFSVCPVQVISLTSSSIKTAAECKAAG